MRQIEFHPFAEEYPLMPALELGRMEQGMTERGFNPRFPIVLYKKKILDGRNRYLAATKAKVKPLFVTFTGTDEQARQFAQDANEERRHLAPEWLQRRRQERIERVAAARVNGETIQTIADQEGVSVSTIHGDIQAATFRGRKVEPETGKITGKDGKERPAKQSKLVPELRAEIQVRQYLPRLVADLELLSEAQQYSFMARTKEGKNPQKALAEVLAELPEREPGDDTEAEADEKARNKAKPKVGAVIWDKKTFEEPYGRLVRAVDQLYKAYGQITEKGAVKADAQHKGLMGILSEFQVAFTNRQKELSKRR